MLLVLASCGGLVASEAGPAVGGEADPVTDAGGGPSATDASADGGALPSVPAPLPPAAVTLRCAFSDGPFVISQAVPAIELFVRLENAQVLLYVSNGEQLRRYRLTSEDPCILQRDLTFGSMGATTARTGVAIDDSTHVWISTGARVSRVFPQPTRRCTMDPGYLDDEDFPIFDAGPLYLDEGGKTGWALGGPPGKLGRFISGTDACSVTLVESPFPFSLRSNTPRDEQGRLHVVDGPAPNTIGIYTATGTFLSSYFAKKSPSDPVATDVTRCAGGVCVLASSATGYELTYATEEGAPRAVLPAIKGLVPRRIAADRIGPVFLAGPSDTKLEPEYQVVIQLAPAPP